MDKLRDKQQFAHEQFEKEGGHDPFEQDSEFAADHFPVKKVDDEEYAAELVPAAPVRTGERRVLPHRDRSRDESQGDAGERVRTSGMLGWVSLMLGIASLFFWQTVLGPASIITGIFAWTRGSRTLGGWAIVLGIVSLIAYFVLVPYYS